MKFDSFNYPPLTFWNSKRKVLIKKVTFLFSHPFPTTFSTFSPCRRFHQNVGWMNKLHKVFPKKLFLLSHLLKTFCFFCFSRLLLNVSQILASSDGRRGEDLIGGIYVFSTWAKKILSLRRTSVRVNFKVVMGKTKRNGADLMISESWNNEKQRLEIGQEKFRLITNSRAFQRTKLKAITARWFH